MLSIGTKDLPIDEILRFVRPTLRDGAPLRMTRLRVWVRKLKRERLYHIYILTNKSRTLYTGVTSNLIKRIWEHKQKKIHGFTKRYNIDRLVYVEAFADIRLAIAREKQIKGWLRSKKIALIESMNPDWKDLSEGMYSMGIEGR